MFYPQSTEPIQAAAPARALIGNGRIREAIRDDDLALIEGRKNPLLDVLRPGCKHQQQLDNRSDLFVGWVEQDAPDLLADGCAAGFHGFEHRPPLAAQTLRQHASLRAFAAAIGAFKSDEQAPLAWGAPNRRHSAGPFSDPPRLPSSRFDCKAAISTRDGR